MTRLILGTAQFGDEYGIVNSLGRLSDDHVEEISRFAFGEGITTFDTSPHYGDAQSRLGTLVEKGLRPDYISKFTIDPDRVDSEAIYGQSLTDLGVETLEGVLFHSVDDLRSPLRDEAWSVLVAAKRAGIIKRVGASIYDSEDADLALRHLTGIDLLQVPGNILDRRLLDHPGIASFRERGGEVHVRSAYLQGLLLSDVESLPQHVQALRPALLDVRAEAARRGVTPAEFALGFLKHHPVVDAVVIGAVSVAELATTLRAWASTRAVRYTPPSIPPGLLDPRKWAELRST